MNIINSIYSTFISSNDYTVETKEPIKQVESLPLDEDSIQEILKLLPLKNLLTFSKVNWHANKNVDLAVLGRVKSVGHCLNDPPSALLYLHDLFAEVKDFYAQNLIAKDYMQMDSMGNVDYEKTLLKMKHLDTVDILELFCTEKHYSLYPYNIYGRLKHFIRYQVKIQPQVENEIFTDIMIKLGEGAIFREYKSNSTFEFLLKRGVKMNVESVDENNETLLFHAVDKDDENFVKLLLAEKANVNFENCFKATPLFQVKSAKIAKILLENGANIDHVNVFSQSALHKAALLGRYDIVKTLLDYDADLSLRDFHGHTAFDSAKVRGHENIVNLFKNY